MATPPEHLDGLTHRPVPDGGDPAPAASAPRKTLRVLVIIDSLALGGAERLLTGFVDAGPAAGLDVSVAVVSPSHDSRRQMLPALVERGVTPEFLGVPRLLSRRAVPQTVDAVRRSGCDVVHAHLEYAATLAAAAGRITRRPVVSTFHHVPRAGSGWRDDAREWLAVAAASRSAHTIFVSQYSRDSFAARYKRMPGRNWTVVRNGIDIRSFSPADHPVPGDLGIPTGTPVVLLPAAMRGLKGHEVAIDAWPDVIAEHPRARLVFAGSGTEEARLHRLAAARGVSGSVVFAGFRTDVAELMRASRLVLLPSLTEALPTVLMEAAACGRPVVASDLEGIPEVVADGDTGILVDPTDAAAVAAAVNALLSDPGRCRDMGARARARAERDFSLERWTADLRSLYESVIAT
ncbi:MAG TPA: glycosyltransferase family 4 protein [Acidimicrobiales bacterium]|nr:glycosyltransferase family 4 protein [Acidimicrobiales bacterium]